MVRPGGWFQLGFGVGSPWSISKWIQIRSGLGAWVGSGYELQQAATGQVRSGRLPWLAGLGVASVELGHRFGSVGRVPWVRGRASNRLGLAGHQVGQVGELLRGRGRSIKSWGCRISSKPEQLFEPRRTAQGRGGRAQNRHRQPKNAHPPLLKCTRYYSVYRHKKYLLK